MAISQDDYKAALRRFARRVPELLVRHGATASLAMDVAKLDLIAQLERRQFTVAVVGRMKAGKSTLLNALVGRALAPVGVNETTATVNWFDHGSGEIEASFEVHWKDEGRPSERRPLTEIDSLSGHSAEAKDIDHVRFHTDSDFLRGVRLVDAPGTMSTIDSHEAATTDFITRAYGERADATILVLPTLVSQADEKLLSDFAEQTRFPGQGPYNTIAVLQKWETLNAAEPEKEAERLADNFGRRLASHVATVLPVSGLMAVMAGSVEEDVFDRLAFLGVKSSTADLTGLFRSEARFAQERPGLPLSDRERAALFAKTRASLLGASAGEAAGTFEMVKFAVGLAHRRGLSSGGALRAAVHAASNLDALKEVLEERFFAVSSLIQAGSVLKKALDPCRKALFTLRDGLERRCELGRRGAGLRVALESAAAADSLAQQMKSFLDRSVAALHDQVGPIDETLRELDLLVDRADRDFRLLMADIECLNALRLGPCGLDPALAESARQLFGQHGMERHRRLALSGSEPPAAQLAAAAALDAAFAAITAARPMHRIARCAQDRLAHIFEEFAEV